MFKSEQAHLSMPGLGSTIMESQHRKRMRAGSISGRLRAASDLEEAGLIDKHQKGYIKDLIISGDPALQDVMDKYEKGDKAPLEALIREGSVGRRQSIDLLDELDFDFLNALTTDGEGADVFDDFYFNLHEAAVTDNTHANSGAIGSAGAPGQSILTAASGPRRRNSSMDSTGSINPKVFDSVAPYLLVGSNLNSTNHQFESFVDTNFPVDYGLNNKNGHHSILPTGLHPASHQRYYSIDQTDFRHLPPAMPLLNPGGRRGSKTKSGIAAANGIPMSTAFQQQQSNPYVDMASAGPAERIVGTKKKMTPRNSLVSMDGLDFLLSGSDDINHHPPSSSSSSASRLANQLTQQRDPPGGNPSHESTKAQAATVGAKSSTTSASAAAHTNGNAAAAVNGLEARKLAGYIGAYTPEERRKRIEKFLDKRTRRVWTKKVKYDVRKNFADSRLRIKGRFVKKEDEDVMREILSM